MTQLEKIKEILYRDGQIDNFYCIQNRLTYRLGARIHDLKEQGFEFETERRGKNYVYKLIKEPEQPTLV